MYAAAVVDWIICAAPGRVIVANARVHDCVYTLRRHRGGCT